MATILVVDDDVTVREVVATYLRAADHHVVEVSDGQVALNELSNSPVDLVVLDLMLPDVDGLEVCRRIRASSDVPIVMLTALGGEEDRVVGLEIGADDYVTKPFSPRELTLRVESVLKRTLLAEPELPDVLTDGDLIVDHRLRAVTRGGQPLSVTAREYDLLRFLLAHPDTTYSRPQLLEHVWGWSFGDLSTVTVHVRRLREKVELDPRSPLRLVTVWGVGYAWKSTGVELHMGGTGS